MKDMHIMIGVPRSGKTTIVNNLYNSGSFIGSIVSRDIIRETKFGDKSNMDNEDAVTKIFNNELTSLMKSGEDVIIDNCNLRFKTRKQLYDMAVKYGYNIYIHLVIADIRTLMHRAEIHNFPKHVIINMLKGNDIAILWSYDKEKYKNIININTYMTEFIEETNLDISQENPHHNETILGHTNKSVNRIEYISNKYRLTKDITKTLTEAMKYHDYGKLYTKEYDSEVGYYRYRGHENISSFMHLHRILSNSKTGILTEEEKLQLILIHFHMVNRGSTPKIYVELSNKIPELLPLMGIFNEADSYRG